MTFFFNLHRSQQRFQFSLKDFRCCAVLGRGHFGKVNGKRLFQVSRLHQKVDTALKFVSSVLGAVGRIQKHK